MIEYPTLVVDAKCPGPETDLVDDFQIATALFVLRTACMTRLPSYLAAANISTPPEQGTAALEAIELCRLVSNGDPLASIAAEQLARFYTPSSLERHRVTIDQARLKRAIAAFWKAVKVGNEAAAQTLLGRALGFLSQPLQAQ